MRKQKVATKLQQASIRSFFAVGPRACEPSPIVAEASAASQQHQTAEPQCINADILAREKEEPRPCDAKATEAPSPVASACPVACPSAPATSAESCKSEDEDEAKGPCDFERMRLERIARNQARLRSLGLETAWAELGAQLKPAKPRPRPKKRKPAQQPETQRTRAYSLRSRGEAPGAEAGGPGGQVNPEVPAAVEEDEAVADDETVKRYICEEAPTNDREADASEDGQPVGLLRTADCFSDGLLTRIYSMHALGNLLAAGGKGGVVAIFGTKALQGEATGEPRAALRAAKLHSGWVADVQLCGRQAGGDAPLLLSAGNDGSLRLWDLQTATASGAFSRLASVEPHTGGVFSMHEQEGVVLTASKDGSVAATRLLPTGGLEPGDAFAGRHEGVAKCVRHRPGAGGVFASCGNDRCIRLGDLREPAAGRLCIPDAHESAASFLAWHPGEQHTLLSTAFEPALHLWDLRQPSGPLHRFLGHTCGRVSAIYQPAFAAGGRAIVSGGQRSSQLAMYCPLSGRTISRGEAGAEALAVHCGGSSGSVFCAVGRSIERFRLRWA